MNAYWRESDEDGKSLSRVDFSTKIVKANDEERTVTFEIQPDLRRYRKIEINGQPYFLDKYLNHVIPENAMLEMASKQLSGLPIYANPPSISSSVNYAASRNKTLNAELGGADYLSPEEKADPQKPIERRKNKHQLAFLSLDICESTKARQRNAEAFDKSYEYLIRELGTVVGQFHGSILKTTGDGFIAYMDFPAFTTQCDNTIDLGLTLLVVLQQSINPALKTAGLPELKIRIGADYGAAKMRNIKIPTTGYDAPEVASDALNRAVKIEKAASKNEFWIGRSLYELIHVQWLERCTKVSIDNEGLGLTDYKIYRVM